MLTKVSQEHATFIFSTWEFSYRQLLILYVTQRGQFPPEAGIFLLFTVPRTVLRLTQSPVRRVMGALSQGLKRSEHKAYHTILESAEHWICGSMAWCFGVGATVPISCFQQAVLDITFLVN
jgi:hypothetical protein